MELNKFVQARYGNYLFNVSDKFIGRSLTEYGEWAEDELQLLKPFLAPGDTVVDIGANIGTHTLGFAEFVGASGRVIAFEPQRLIYQCLCANLALNNLAHVWALQVGVSDRQATMSVPQVDYNFDGNFGGIALCESGNGEQVPIVCLDDYNLTVCRLIKIDVEGMEYQVLKGAHKTISALKPVLYVENNKSDRSDELITFIEQLGYKVYWHFSPFFSPTNFYNNPVNVFGDNVFDSNLLCLNNADDSVVDFISAADAREPEEAFNLFMNL